MAAEFLLTSSLDPIEKGDRFESEPLPRHVTVLQWFTLEQPKAFVNALQNYAVTVSPFEVKGGEDALFGPDNDVLVRRIRTVGKLASVHSRIVELVDQFGGSLKHPEWAGEGCHPHVSYVKGLALEDDEAVTLKNLELISREQGTSFRTVEHVLPLSKRS